jgi:hypothetical protein
MRERVIEYHLRCVRGHAQLETWWQSDGKSPHIAQVTFPTRTTVIGVAVCMIYSVDESYTPSKVSGHVCAVG